MDISALKKMVSEAYAVTDSANAIPKFSTQFTFTEKQVLVRIPVFELLKPSPTLVELLCKVINAALPNEKKTPGDLRQDLMTALEGKQVNNSELDIRGISSSTIAEGGVTAHAVSECRVLIGKVA